MAIPKRIGPTLNRPCIIDKTTSLFGVIKTAITAASLMQRTTHTEPACVAIIEHIQLKLQIRGEPFLLVTV
jgi:hypothetical protein